MILIRQPQAMDFGPTSIRMVAKCYFKHFTLETLRNRAHISREGVSLQGISRAEESISFRSKGVNIPFENFYKDAPLPAIVHWNQSHFVVVPIWDGNKEWFFESNCSYKK